MRATLFLAISLLAAPAAAQPNMSKAEMTQLYQAAGFPIVADQPRNRCGAVARPGTTFVDLNEDKRAEILFVDANPGCYKEGGTYFAVLTRVGTSWRLLVSGDGSIKARATRTNGWLDMSVSAKGINRYFTFNGALYTPASAVAATPPAIAATPPTTARPGAAAAGPTAAWTLPKKAASLTTAERTALFRAAGFVQQGGQWKGCAGESLATIDDEAVEGGAIRDLNGDGRPEVVLTDGGTACYGMTGTGFQIMTPTATGWKVFWNSPGIPTFLPEKGAGGWPNIEAGGPGFCQPVYGWDGKLYDIRYFKEYDRGACRRQEVPTRIPVRAATTR